MSVALVLASLALATAPDCATPAVDGRVVQVGLTAFGKELGGVGVVSLDATHWSLTMLTATGTELFTASDAGISSGVPAWEPWLRRMPLERDLRLVYTETAGASCRAPTGTIREKGQAEGWKRRTRGACARRVGPRVDLRAAGYRMVLVDAP